MTAVTVTSSSTLTTTVTVFTIDPSMLVPAPNVDPLKGVWMLRLKASDIANWPLGFLCYGIVCDRIGGDQVMLYTDRNYNPYGQLAVLQGPYPLPPEVTSLTPEQFTPVGLSLQSGAYPGAANVGNLSGIQSIVFQANAFTGSVTIQGSLENQPSTNASDWFLAPIDPTMLTGGSIDPNSGSVFFQDETTGPVFMQTIGNYMWVRFIVHSANANISNYNFGGGVNPVQNYLANLGWTGIDYRND